MGILHGWKSGGGDEKKTAAEEKRARYWGWVWFVLSAVAFSESSLHLWASPNGLGSYPDLWMPVQCDTLALHCRLSRTAIRILW